MPNQMQQKLVDYNEQYELVDKAKTEVAPMEEIVDLINNNDIKEKNENKKEEKKDTDISSKKKIDEMGNELLYTYLDEDQDIPEMAKNLVEPDSILNKVDKNWKYNLTYGDLEKWRIKLPDGKTEELWFPKEGSIRKVFVAIKIKRVSNVDNIAETFRMRFHMYFNWLATKEDYISHCKATLAKELYNDVEQLLKWEPKWYPHLEFQNMIEEHVSEWENYPEQGCFRMQVFKDFGHEKGAKIPPHIFDSSQAKFIRAKLECEMTFAEELELQSFPFDCQDLSCVIHERTTGGVRCVFLPELRAPQFASIDPRYSVIDEWDLETAIIEFGDADPNASRSNSSYAMIVLRLKIKRRWQVFLWNIVFLMACICALSLTAFALNDDDDLGNRLNLLITLVLTAVAFSYVIFSELPNVPYLTFMDKYILTGYTFIVGIMIESAFLKSIGPENDIKIFYFCAVLFITYNVFYAFYARKVRQDEQNKLFYSSDEIEEEVTLNRPSLKFDYTKRVKSGTNGRLLSFLGTMTIPHNANEEQRKKMVKKQDDIQALYEQRVSGLTQRGNISPLPSPR